MKLGKEVEGRLKGLRTLFMTADEAINLFAETGPLKVKVKSKFKLNPEKLSEAITDVQAVYISDRANVLTPDHAVFEPIRSLDVVISVERTEVAEFWPDDICVLLRVENPSFWYLKETDQVKFSYDQNVRCVTLENMSVTNPEDFRGDVQL